MSTAPVLSQDGSTLALVHVTESGGNIGVSASMIDLANGGAGSQGSFALRNATPDCYVVTTPAIAPDGSSLGIVVSISSPANRRTVAKLNPETGQASLIPTADWTTHHELLFMDGPSGACAGPFDLDDAPALARVTAVASTTDLYVWSMGDPTYQGAASQTVAAYPLGSGVSRFSVAAPGPWPVSGEPTMVLPNGDFARVIYATAVEVYSASDGTATLITPVALQGSAAKPSAPHIQHRPDGTILWSNPPFGVAAVLDPASGFETSQAFQFPVPLNASGLGPKVVLSADGETLFAVAPSQTFGINAYQASTGKMIAAVSTSSEVTLLSSSTSGLIAASVAPNQLTWFDNELDEVTAVTPPCSVVAIY